MSVSYRIEERGEPDGSLDKAFLVFECGKKQEQCCRVSLWRLPQSGIMWNWDGNRSAPTVVPSVHCLQCGRHFSITKGVVT